MFLVIGHSPIAVNLARWCSERRPTRQDSAVFLVFASIGLNQFVDPLAAQWLHKNDFPSFSLR